MRNRLTLFLVPVFLAPCVFSAGDPSLTGRASPEALRKGAEVAAGTQKKDNKPTQMEWKDAFGGLPESGQFVVRDSETWKNLWLRIRDDAPAEIDFSKKMVLAAFLGVRSTGGYSIVIESVERQKKKIIVSVREIKPPRKAMVIQAITSPYHMKVIDRSDAAVVFKSLK